EKNIGITFVVTQHDVVRRTLILDEVLLEQQSLGFAVGQRGLDAVDLVDQGQRLVIKTAATEVVAQSLLEILRLTDIERLAVGIQHAIDTWARTGVLEESFVVEAFFTHAKCAASPQIGVAT